MTTDNRIKFPPTRIDFDNDVGVTGQDHDNWPAASAQIRFDWARLYYIGLLSSQSSYDEPTQYRIGTPWFDLNTMTMKIRTASDWSPITDVMSVGNPGTGTEDTTTLSEWIGQYDNLLNVSSPELTFSGSCTANNTAAITIPTTLQGYITLTKNKPFVYINGLLLDPRNAVMETVTTINLINGQTINNGDTFTVIIKNITTQLFHVPDVNIPPA